MSRFYRPGVTTTNIPGLNTTQSVKVRYFDQCNSCAKPVIQNVKLNNGIVNPTQTQSQRLAEIVNFYAGGKVQYGNNTNCLANITYLGKTEGQPGGIVGPLRNKY